MNRGPRRTPTGVEVSRHPGRGARVLLALKLAFRWSWREKGRSALIVSLIAIPVVGMAAVCLIAPSMVPTTQEQLAVDLGQTQAKIRVVAGANDGGLQQDPFGIESWGWSSDRTSDTEPLAPVDVLPAGTDMIPLVTESATFQTANGARVLSTTVGEAWDPRLSGRFDVAAGGVPSSPDEVMVTQGALDRLGVSIGGTVDIVAPVERTVVVVGVLDAHFTADSTEYVFALPATLDMSDIGTRSDATIYLPGTALDWEQVRDLNAKGAVALSRTVVQDPPDTEYGGGRYSSGPMALLMIAPLFFGFGVLEVVLLAGAAFLVSARSRERALATLVSVGAPRSAVFGVISASGVVLGLIGGILGVGLGIAGGSLFMALTDTGSATQYWGYHFWWPLFLAIAGAATLIGWLGALVPAIRATRVDVVAALRGARVPPKPKKRHPIVGLVLVIVGIAILVVSAAIGAVLKTQGVMSGALATLIIALYVIGPVTALLGLLFCSGLVLRLVAKLLAPLSLAARVASRDTARNAARSVPALAAVLVTVFIAVFWMTFTSSAEATQARMHQYTTNVGDVKVPLAYGPNNGGDFVPIEDPEPYLDAAKRTLDTTRAAVLKAVPDPVTHDSEGNPVTQEAPVPQLTVPSDAYCPVDPRSSEYRESSENRIETINTDPRCRSSYVTNTSYGPRYGAHLWVGDADDLALILGRAPSSEARAALSSGHAVSLYDAYVVEGHVSVSWWTVKALQNSFEQAKWAPTRIEELAAVVDKPEHPIDFGVMISPATADRLGLHYEDTVILASPETPPTDEQIDALNAALWNLTGVNNSLWSYPERGPTSFAGPVAWGILGLSLVIALGAAAVAIGLARADGLRDKVTLWSVGAGTVLRRGVSFWQALILTGVGAVLGALLGLVPPLAFAATESNLDFAAPWLPLALTAFGMPLAIALGAWLVTHARPPMLTRTAIG